MLLFFIGEVSEASIVRAENKLGGRFPKEYREYVEKFGSGGICGVEVLGVGGHDYASVVDVTERYRKLGLRENYLVIKNVDELVYGLNMKGSFTAVI